MLPIFVGWIVGMLATTPPGRDLRRALAARSLLMLAVVLLRPLFFVADTLVRNHAITPNLVDLVRWQSHWHVIRQTWTFFQNDFAGRIANKVMQAGEAIEMAVNLTIDAVWYAVVFVVVAVIVLAGIDPVLLVPIAIWLVPMRVLFRWTMPHIDAHLRGGLRGAVGDDRADGRQLHQHPDAEDLRRRRRTRTPTSPSRCTQHVGDFRRLMRDLHLQLVAAVPAQRAAWWSSVTWIALAGWNAGHDDRGDGGDGHPLRAADHEHVGLDPRDRLQHLPPDRHGARTRWRPSPSR